MTARNLARVPVLATLLIPAACAASPLQSRAGAWEIEVLANGAPAQTFWHAGESYVMGHLGERYTLRVRNNTGRRIEAVVSVDGRDVIDGKPADMHKRGYLVPAWGSVDIDGWRVSESQAAAFRFSRVADSYAARTGSARDVGVIGLAVFPERFVPPPPPPRPIYVPRPRPFGYEDGYNKDRSEAANGAPAPSAPSGQAAPRESGGAYDSEDSRSADSSPYKRSDRRPGLGTEYGESLQSQVTEVEFRRANPARPAAVLGLRYNDRAGLLAMGVDVDGATGWDDSDLRRSAHPFPVSDRRYAAPPPGWRGY